MRSTPKTDRDQKGSNGRRLRSNLRRHQQAMDALGAMGLTADTVAAAEFGIKEPYVQADGNEISDVLSVPVAVHGSRVRYASVALPGVTGGTVPSSWAAGKPMAIQLGAGDTLLVCSDALEAWAALQAASSIGVEVAVTASTHADAVPEEWCTRRQWSGWRRILVSEAASLTVRRALEEAGRSGFEIVGARPVGSPCDPVDPSELDEWLREALGGKGKISSRGIVKLDCFGTGDFEPERLSAHGGMSRGRMFYAFTIERRERRNGKDGTLLCRYQTLVVRSDGAILDVATLPAPAGTPADRRVLALSDGTRIHPLSPASQTGSWSLMAIKRFVEQRDAGEHYSGQTPGDLAGELEDILRGLVWLPDDSSYGVVVAYLMASYFHRAFSAFPMLYIVGPKGSGKSELLTAVAAAAFNGAVMSQGSAAALMRLAADSGGLVAIDDAETLRAGFGEIAQVLKQGYKAATAVKRVAGVAGGTTSIDFFGPRAICNTSGLDAILLSRSVQVRTLPAPADFQVSFSDHALAAWRDQMHSFVMWHAEELALAPAACTRRRRDRIGELMVPFDVVARLTGRPSISDAALVALVHAAAA